MSPPAETEEHATRFDLWGRDLAAAQAAGHRARIPASWRVLTALGIAVAVASALIVHLAGGGSRATAPRLSPSERAIAAAINLRAADAPGFTVSYASHDVAVGGDPGNVFKSCYGGAPASVAGDAPEADSPSFVQSNGFSSVSLGSSVSFSSAAQIDRDARLAADPRLSQCFAQAMAALTFTVHGTQITGADASAAIVPLPIVAGQAVLAMRARMNWTARGITIPTYLDLYVVGVGREEVSLYTFSTMQPYSAAQEQLLLSELVTRARANPY